MASGIITHTIMSFGVDTHGVDLSLLLALVTVSVPITVRDP